LAVGLKRIGKFRWSKHITMKQISRAAKMNCHFVSGQPRIPCLIPIEFFLLPVMYAWKVLIVIVLVYIQSDGTAYTWHKFSLFGLGGFGFAGMRHFGSSQQLLIRPIKLRTVNFLSDSQSQYGGDEREESGITSRKHRQSERFLSRQ
jgi:hypothetical protein